MIEQFFVYIHTLLFVLSLNLGPSTRFGENDEGNPNPHLACVRNTMVLDTMPIVAHRTYECGSEVFICKIDFSRCTTAIVADRLGHHCRSWNTGKCVEYWSELDMTPAVVKALDHSGSELVWYINVVGEEWQRKKRLLKLKNFKRKYYKRLNS